MCRYEIIRDGREHEFQRKDKNFCLEGKEGNYMHLIFFLGGRIIPHSKKILKN